ncbi:MAG: VOC family protein [Chloroflexota bacterium]|nr:VOC family protein [Chloroflexota bacterium]
MLTGIDHVIAAVGDPDAAARQIEGELGLEVRDGGRHEAHGTFNRLVWFGDSYFELISVFDEGRASTSWWGRHVLDILSRAAAGHMGMALASEGLAADVELLRARGSGLGPPEPGERRRTDGRVVRWHLARAERADPDIGLFFLIERDQGSAEWTAAERATRATQAHPLGGPVRLERIEIPVADVRATTMGLHRDVGVAFRPSLAGDGARDGTVGRQTLRLVSRARRSAPRIALVGGAREVVAELLGYEWEFRPSV